MTFSIRDLSLLACVKAATTLAPLFTALSARAQEVTGLGGLKCPDPHTCFKTLEAMEKGGATEAQMGRAMVGEIPEIQDRFVETAGGIDWAAAAHAVAYSIDVPLGTEIAVRAIVAGVTLVTIVTPLVLGRRAYVTGKSASITRALEPRFSDARWDGTITDGLVSWTLKSQGGGGGWPTPHSKTLIFAPEYVRHQGSVDQGVPFDREVPLSSVPPIDFSLINNLREGGQRVEVVAEPLFIHPQDYPDGVIAAGRHHKLGDAAMRRTLQRSLTDPAAYRELTVMGYGGNGCYQAIQSLMSLPPQLRSRVKRLVLISPVTEYARGRHQTGPRGLWATFAGTTIKQKGLPWIPYEGKHMRPEAKLPEEIPTVTEAVLGRRMAALRKMCAGGHLQGLLEGITVTLVFPEQDEIVGVAAVAKNVDTLKGGLLGRFGHSHDNLQVCFVPGTHLVFSGKDAGLHRTGQVVGEAYRPRSRGFGEDRRARRQATFRVA